MKIEPWFSISREKAPRLFAAVAAAIASHDGSGAQVLYERGIISAEEANAISALTRIGDTITCWRGK